ncbi:MAG: FAD-dependent oxidoreductase, partial [Gammaproteobacteria bacterium]|nr:FAD-dependent oxidoreductase [Gammaproteobacteria bacterium]
MMNDLIIIGNGMAPGRALEKLNEGNPDAYNVTIFNAEPRVSYNRVMLSPVLSGEEEFEKTIIHGDDWYFKHNFILYRGCPVTEIDREAKVV